VRLVFGCVTIVVAILSAHVQPAGSQNNDAPVRLTAPTGALPTQPASIRRQHDAPLPGALSPRNANYELDARLDHATRTIAGTGLIRWRNIGLAPATSLRLHLYWNAWRHAQSTWMREAALAGTTHDVRPDEWSSIDLQELTLLDPAGSPAHPLLPQAAFVQPDDGNAEDRTLISVDLPRGVRPGEEITLRVAWQSRVPRTFARTGRIGSFYFIAHWFPKLAVFEGDSWTAHQFHANTEFYSDYGRYDVRLTVPRGWSVGATGAEQSQVNNEDGTTTHRYVQDDVHDFAWTTSPEYVEHRRRFAHPGLPEVQMRLLLQPEHAGQEDRHFAATEAALRYYGEWYGAYPYEHITIVDPAFGSRAGGMEYPTIFTAGTHWLAPRQSNTPEGVTIHEAGHQFWYGVVGNNEVEHAWLDEGLNTFSEARVASIAFAPDYHVERFFGGFVPWLYGDIALSRETDLQYVALYRAAAEWDAPASPTWRYWPVTHWGISYSKTALWLHTLERHLGWDTLQRILSAFFQRWKFRHPQPEDFFATVNEISGQDLTWFFDQVYRSTHEFDYGVAHVTSDEQRTVVVVRRYGEARFPVDVAVTFADGERVVERWEGQERWRAYEYTGGGASNVWVDPERVLLLDTNRTNNSWTAQSRGADAATKWSLAWTAWLQDLLLTWAFLV
jgi:hypothetical protein